MLNLLIGMLAVAAAFGAFVGFWFLMLFCFNPLVSLGIIVAILLGPFCYTVGIYISEEWNKKWTK